MSVGTGNRYLWRENSQSYDGSYYSDNTSLQSQEHYYDGSYNSENNFFYSGERRHSNFGDMIERSDSYCSTCPSEDYYTDSEDEDAAQKWPWISQIQDNGDLIYVHTHHQHKHSHPRNHNHNHSNSNHHKPRTKSFLHKDNKEKGLQGKLKNVIKKSRSFTKKDVIDKNIDISHFKNSEKKKQQNPLTDTTTEIQTITTDGVHLLCKNVLIHLNDKVQESFANLENVIGVISGLDLDPVLDDFSDNILMNGNSTRYNSNCIVVQGIIPNSPAGESEINIGDIILAINGIKVNLQSVNSIVEKINGTQEIVLTIERLATVVEPEKPSELCSIVSNTLDEGAKEDVFHAYHDTCMVSLLTLNSNEDDVDGDILFWYPDSEKSKILRNTRGIFLTLSDMLTDVMAEHIQSSVLYTNKETINVAYKKCGGNVLVVAAPDHKCDLNTLISCTDDFAKLLTILNGDLNRAFTDENMESTRHETSLFLDLLLQRKPVVPFGTVRQLQLPTKQMIEISNVLSDVEAADYGECVDDFFPHQRLYGTIGTCLFYKDNLVCSHLTDENLQDVVTFCKYHWLFMLAKSEKMKQLVLWKEIFLTEKSGESPTTKNSYETPENARWFILVVGQGHSLFCTLLETGGAASIPEGNPGPHPYYVDTAWSILTYLIENMDYETSSHSRLEGPSIPAVVHATEAINPKTSASPRAIELIKRKVPIQRRPHHDHLSISHSISNESDLGMRERSQSRTSNLSGNSSNRHYSVHEMAPHFKQLSMASTSEVSTTAALATKLPTGSHNTLFYFTVLSNRNGVFVSPNAFKSSNMLTGEILTNYTSACEKIHKWFEKKQLLPSEPLELGVLFDLQLTKGAEMKKGFPNIRYWVVGRKMKKRNKCEEVYVCFQDGTPQNVIEMAFKIRFGCHY